MSYHMLSMIWMFFVFVYFPIITLIFIIMAIFVLKKIIKNGGSVAPGVIFVKMIPALLVYVILATPLIYINKKYNNYDYCKTIVKVNKITDPKNSTLLERCSFYDIDELISEQGK